MSLFIVFVTCTRKIIAHYVFKHSFILSYKINLKPLIKTTIDYYLIPWNTFVIILNYKYIYINMTMR